MEKTINIKFQSLADKETTLEVLEDLTVKTEESPPVVLNKALRIYKMLLKNNEVKNYLDLEKMRE